MFILPVHGKYKKYRELRQQNSQCDDDVTVRIFSTVYCGHFRQNTFFFDDCTLASEIGVEANF